MTKSSKQTESQSFDLEKSLEKLSLIAEKLDTSSLPLEQSLELFEQGINIAKECEQHLTKAEQKVEILISSIKDKFETKPFNVEDSN